MDTTSNDPGAAPPTLGITMTGTPLADQIRGTIGDNWISGQGGLILVDWRGRTGWAHSTPLLPVGFMSPSHAAPIVPF